MSPQEVLRFLEGVSLSPSLLATTPTSSTVTRSTTVRAATGRSGGSGGGSGRGSGGGNGVRSGGSGSLGCDMGIPLINGRALGVAYLEWLVSNDTRASLNAHTRRTPHHHSNSSGSSSSGSSSGNGVTANSNEGVNGSGVNGNGSGDGTTSSIHDEYAQLLMEGIPFDVDVESTQGGGGESMWENLL